MKKLSIIITLLSVSLFSQTYQMEWQFPVGYTSYPFHEYGTSRDYNGDGFEDILISQGDSSIIIIDPTANYSEILSFQYPHAYAGGAYIYSGGRFFIAYIVPVVPTDL